MRAVLTYHSIDPSDSPISIAAEVFRRHLRWLEERNIAVIPLSSILDPGPIDAVALTFDDGFRNFEEVALPQLVAHGFPATLFIVSRMVGRTNQWNRAGGSRLPLLPLLDWNGIERVAAQGIDIGAHGRTHASMTSIDTLDVGGEVAGCQADIRRALGITPRSFCYPYGNFDASVHAAVAASYSVAVTSELRELNVAMDEPHLIPRIDMYYFRRRGWLESWGTPAFARYLRLRRAGRQAKRSLAHVTRTWRS